MSFHRGSKNSVPPYTFTKQSTKLLRMTKMQSWKNTRSTFWSKANQSRLTNLPMQRFSTKKTWSDTMLTNWRVFAPLDYSQYRVTKIYLIKQWISANWGIDRTRLMKRSDFWRKKFKGSKRWTNPSRTRTRKTMKLRNKPVVKSSIYKTNSTRKPRQISKLWTKRSKCRTRLQKSTKDNQTILEKTTKHLKV